MDKKILKKLLNEKYKDAHFEVSEADVFTSSEFHNFLDTMIYSLLGESCNLEMVHDENNTTVACTDGQRIFLNTNNPLSQGYISLNAKTACIIGIVAHECAHKLYLDFDADHTATKEMNRGYIYRGVDEEGGLTEDENEWKTALETAMQNPPFRIVLSRIFHEISNIVADAHDEASFCRDHDGLAVRGLTFSTSALRCEMPALENMADWNPLSIATCLMLQVARYQEIIALSQTTIENNEVAQSIIALSPFLNKARCTDNYDARAKLINRCILHLWPYIEDAIEQCQKEKQNENANDNQQENQAANSTTDSLSGTGNSSTQGGQSSGNANQPNGSTSMPTNASSASLQEIVQALLDQIQKASQGGTTAPRGSNNQQPQAARNRLARQNSTSSEEQGNPENQGDTNEVHSDNKQNELSQQSPSQEDSSHETDATESPSFDGTLDSPNEQTSKHNPAEKEADNEKSSLPHKKPDKANEISKSGSSTQKTPPPQALDCSIDPALKQLLDSLVTVIEQKKKQEYANEHVEDIIASNLNCEVHAANQTSPHKGRPIIMHREMKITASDKEQYEKIYCSIKRYSQQMQRKIGALLADLREGSIEHHRSYGRLVEANDGYRPDGKFFAKKKLPQELPDMAVAVLLDQSGSMAGPRLKSAIQAAVLLNDFATGLGLPIMIAGHNTATCSKGTDIYIHTTFDRVGDKDKYRIVQANAHGSNRDGMALNIMVDQLYKRPEDIKMLIIVSDGQPNGDCYGGPAAEQDIQSIVSLARTKGVQVFAAAIGDDKEQIERIYGDGFLDVSDLNSLPKKMAHLISKRIL